MKTTGTKRPIPSIGIGRCHLSGALRGWGVLQRTPLPRQRHHIHHLRTLEYRGGQVVEDSDVGMGSSAVAVGQPDLPVLFPVLPGIDPSGRLIRRIRLKRPLPHEPLVHVDVDVVFVLRGNAHPREGEL